MQIMRMKWQEIAAVAIAALCAVRAGAAEEKIKSEDLPKSAASALMARFPGMRFINVAKETGPDGQEVYDVELKQRDRKFETDIKPDGTMLEVEKEIMKRDWSKVLHSTVETKYPKSAIEEVMEVNKVKGKKEIPDHLEVTIKTADEKSVEILVSLDGKRITDESAGENRQAAVEEKAKPNSIPKVLSEAIQTRFPKADIVSSSKEVEDGKTLYEVTIKSEKHNIDVSLTPQGKIVSFERALLSTDRPKAMMKSLNSKYPHATIKLAEEVWENDKLTGYEATIITADKKTLDVAFDTKGRLIENEKKN